MIKYICFFVLFSVSCDDNLHKGTIIQRKYEPTRIYNRVEHIYSNGMMKPFTNTVIDKEDFIIIICDTITLKKQKLYVSKNTYKNVKIGDYFDGTVAHLFQDIK